jgi:hypothetical protein
LQRRLFENYSVTIIGKILRRKMENGKWYKKDSWNEKIPLVALHIQELPSKTSPSGQTQ